MMRHYSKKALNSSFRFFSTKKKPTQLSHGNVDNILSIQSKNALQSISIFDVNGRQLKSVSSNSNKRNIEINTSSLSEGIYFIKIKTEQGFLVKKLLIRKG